MRGASHFSDLRATYHDESRVELQGTLQDDLNQAIANAVVTLPNHLAPRSCDNSALITTDHQGKFCALVNNRGGATRVVFAGDNLLEETSAVIPTQPQERPPVTLAIDTPLEWSRNAQQHVVNLTINSNQSLLASVSLLREGSPVQTLPRLVFSQTRAVAEVPTEGLPKAGPLTIRVQVVTPQGSVVTEGERGIDLTSSIHLALRQQLPESVRTGDDLILHFDVSGDPPSVDSGWIEVQADGVLVAMAPVSAGQAQVTVSPQAARQRMIELRASFVPQHQFHIPGKPLNVSVSVLGPRQWLHIPLAALLLGFAWRIVKVWRRPAREPVRATTTTTGDEASVVRLEPEVPLEGWLGKVLDTHTGLPIANATVALLIPTLVPGPPERQAVTGSDGSFRFDKLTPLPEGSRLVVHAAHHSSLECSAPQPGILTITLVARRRTLLSAVKDWANFGSSPPHPDPTPLELARLAQAQGDAEGAHWIRLVDEAVYGQDPVVSSTEASLLGRRPARVQSSAKGR